MKALKIIVSILLMIMSGCAVRQFITDNSQRTKTDLIIHIMIITVITLAVFCIWI